MIDKLGIASYEIWMIFVEYKKNPMTYNYTFYNNMTTPYFLLKFYKNSGQGTVNKEVYVSGCEAKPIQLYFPLRSYGTFINYINDNRLLFDPKLEKSPYDPIFKLPIYINETGYITNDTVTDRIAKYHRKYNFSCNYYDTNVAKFNTEGLSVNNYTSGYVSINTPHLTDFVVKMSDNPQTFLVDTDFFYVAYPAIFLNAANYVGNLPFYVIAFFIGYYLIILTVTAIFDAKLYKQEVLLEFIKNEVVKSFNPYDDSVHLSKDEIPFPEDLLAIANDGEAAGGQGGIFNEPIEIQINRKGDSNDDDDSRRNSMDSNDIYKEKVDYTDSDMSASNSEASGSSKIDFKVEDVDDKDIFGIGGLGEKPKEKLSKEDEYNRNLDDMFEIEKSGKDKAFFDKNADDINNIHRRKALDFDPHESKKEKTIRRK